MKKRKRPGKNLRALLLSAAIICSAILPAFAEEPAADSPDMENPSAESLGAENQILKSQGEETQDEETEDSTLAKLDEEIPGDSAESEEAPGEDGAPEALEEEAEEEGVTESSNPRVTAESITWDGGQLKIPVDLGGYTSDEILLVLRLGPENTETIQTWRYPKLEGDFAIYSPMSDFKSCDEKTFWTKEGIYRATLEFHLADDSEKLINEDNFAIVVPTSSEMWQVEEKLIKFDGSQDLTFSFKNGTNYYALSNIECIELFMWKDPAYQNPAFGGDGVIECDMAGGTITVNKNDVAENLKEAVKEAQQKGVETFPTRAYVNTFAVTSSGEEIRFNIIDKEENGMTLHAPAWELDLTEFDWTQEELKIVPEVTDYSYTKGDRDGATIKCTGALEDFESAYMDNVLVDPSNYTLENGSTILTFTTKYLNTLSVGKHTVTMNYTYGSVDTELTVKEKTNSGGSGTTGKPKPGKPVTSATPTTSSTPEATTQPSGTTSVTTPTSTAVSSGTTAATGAAVPSGTANTGNTSGNTSVQTGDDSSVLLWVLAAMFAFGTCGITCIILFKKRNIV